MPQKIVLTDFSGLLFNKFTIKVNDDKLNLYSFKKYYQKYFTHFAY